jgi:hypothetical protein
VLATQKDEDAGDERDNSSNKAEVESENSDQADKDQINRQQKHSDVFCKGHGAMICGYSERSRGCNAADIVGEAGPSISFKLKGNASGSLGFARDDGRKLQTHQFADVFYRGAAEGENGVVILLEIEGAAISCLGAIAQVKMLGHTDEVGR